MPQCKAKSKQSGERCKRWAAIDREVCVIHGGKTLQGAASGTYQHGRYSKSLPTQLAARAEEARRNPRLLSLDDDIAVAEARLAQLFEQVETGEAGRPWRALQGEMEAFGVASRLGDAAALEGHFQAMRTLVEQEVARGAAWEEIGRVWERRCKLVQTQVKTLTSLQQMVTSQQMMLFLGAIMSAVTEAVKKHVEVGPGRKVLMDIQTEFTRLATLEER